MIASGGVGTLDHLVEGIRDGHATAVLAASIFHFGDLHDARGQGPYGRGRPAGAAGSVQSSCAIDGRVAWISGRWHDPRAARRASSATARRRRRGLLHRASCSTRASSNAPRSSARRRSRRRSRPSAEDRERSIAESADLLYHLLVVLEARGVALAEVEAVLGSAHRAFGPRREGVAQERLSVSTAWTSATDDGLLALPRLLAREHGRRLRDDTPMTLTADEVDAAALAARPARHRRGRGHLPAAVAPALALCRGDAAAVSSRSSASSAPTTPRCPTSSASPARSRSASRPPRACCRRCWRAGRTCPKVDLVTTDGFLYPNAVLEREGLMEKKGFPESYDLPALLRFLADVKAGRRPVARAGLFASHLRRGARTNGSRSTGPTS